MAYIRSHRGKFQALARIQGHPFIAKIFFQRKDAKRWATETELKMRREDAGIAKVKYPLFREIALRYVNEVSVRKKCFRVERNIINLLLFNLCALFFSFYFFFFILPKKFTSVSKFFKISNRCN
jgi:hypothetical protein